MTTSGRRDGQLSCLVRAGLLTGIVDGLFSSTLSVAAYGSTVTRLFKGLASVPLGEQALFHEAKRVAAGVGAPEAVQSGRDRKAAASKGE